MVSVSSITYAVGYALLWVTFVASIRQARRFRDARRQDVLWLVAVLVAEQVLRGTPAWLDALRSAALLSQSYFLVRLLRHFREAPRFVAGASIAMAVTVPALMVAWPTNVSGLWTIARLLLAAVQAFVAIAFIREAWITRGVTSRRLLLAAVGALAAGGRELPHVLYLAVPALNYVLPPYSEFLTGASYIAYYFAFATPRRLLARWQHAEQAKYLSHTAAFDAEERGRRVPQDLTAAVSSSVGNAITLVALHAPSAPALIVRAATDTTLIDREITASPRALTQAVQAGEPRFSAPAECEPELAAAFARRGTTVLIAPIATNVRVWGVVVVVQRRGSLFPEDDLRLLEQLGRHAGIALDHALLVTEARERERRAADRRLREVEWRMSLMLDSIKDYAMFVLDDHGKVVVWHIGAQHVFGYESQEMIDRDAGALYGLTPDEFQQWLDTARRDGRAEREGPCHRRNGHTFIGASVVRPLEDDVDKLAGFVAVTRDVTEHRDLEARLRQSQKMDAIGQLAGGVAHDFNNILAAIRGYADLLALELPEDDEASLRRVKEIADASDRGAGLTQQLLQFSRRRLLEQVELNVDAVVREMLPMLRRLIGGQVTITEDFGCGAVTVLGDRTQLQQIVVNLVVNARDAMPTGGRLTVRTASTWLDASSAGDVATPGAHVLLEIADSGIGMDAATQARIFEPFFTTKPIGRGTGLGLATVYGIVKQMRGLVRVASEPGAGSTFRLYFPVAVAVAGAAAEETPDVPRAASGSETLLVVEDDPAVREFLVEVLRKHGYAVLGAEDLTSALEVARTHPDGIALAIVDVVMAGGTGPEFVRALQGVRPGTPALYISGYADAVFAQQGGFPRATHFLQKPFSSADLLARVRLILDRPPAPGT